MRTWFLVEANYGNGWFLVGEAEDRIGEDDAFDVVWAELNPDWDK